MVVSTPSAVVGRVRTTTARPKNLGGSIHPLTTNNLPIVQGISATTATPRRDIPSITEGFLGSYASRPDAIPLSAGQLCIRYLCVIVPAQERKHETRRSKCSGWMHGPSLQIITVWNRSRP